MTTDPGYDPGYTEPKPGDLCRILPGYRVSHYKCDEHPDGTITNIITGKVEEA